MIIYSREKHEPLLVHWFYNLKGDEREFANLFAEPLRNLTAILWWAEHSVKLMFSHDDDGIKYAAWVEPYMSGAFFGFWSRKDQRHGIGQAVFIDRAFKLSFETFPILIGITKQKHLHQVHLALGYEYVGEFEGLFDGDPAFVYKLTRE